MILFLFKLEIIFKYPMPIIIPKIVYIIDIKLEATIKGNNKVLSLNIKNSLKF